MCCVSLQGGLPALILRLSQDGHGCLHLVRIKLDLTMQVTLFFVGAVCGSQMQLLCLSNNDACNEIEESALNCGSTQNTGLAILTLVIV